MWRIFVAFFDAGDEDALLKAVQGVEAQTCAEVVVAVRRRSGSYRDANVLIGSLCATATLAFALFSPWPFSLRWIFLDPVLVGVATALGAGYAPALQRWVTLGRERRRRVEVHARSMFVERGIDATTGRTGILVYVSILERDACVVADTGVTSRVPAAEWRDAVGEIERAARQSKAAAVVQAISKLGPVLARHLPRAHDDVNELADEVSVS
jgi:putative membrane protein